MTAPQEQERELHIRQKALEGAIRMTMGDSSKTIQVARSFYDFLKGDVETASDSREPASDQ